MNARDARPEASPDELPPDDDTVISVVPDPEMEAAMSEALAPVVARASNGAARAPDNSRSGGGSVIEVSSAGVAQPVEPSGGAAEKPAETDAAGAPSNSDEPEDPLRSDDLAASEQKATADKVAPESQKTAEPDNEIGTDTEPEADLAAGTGAPTEIAARSDEPKETMKRAEPVDATPPPAPDPPPQAERSPEPTRPEPVRAVSVVPPPAPDPWPQADPSPEPTRPEPVRAAAVVPPPPEPPAPQEPAQSPEYAAMTVPSAGNRIYDHLVEGDDDVIGLITYSLYEKDRRDWLQHWQRQHNAEPTAEQYEAFIEAQLTFSQRDRYRSAARQVLDAYASVAVDLEKPVIIRDGIAGRVEDAAKRVEGSGRWWRQLPAALVGGALMAVIVVAIIAILVASGVDIAGYLGFEQTAADG